MTERRILQLITGLICIIPGFANAQILPADALSAPELARLNVAEQRFDTMVQQFETLLKTCQRFTVNVTSQWTSRGGAQDAAGTNLYRVISQTQGRLLIEAGSKEMGPVQFVCVSNGRTVTRWNQPSKYYSQQPVSDLYKELEGDPMTVRMLGLSGIDFLIRPDFRAHLVAQIRVLKDLGTEVDQGKKVRHFQLTLVDNRMLDTWFQEEGQPLLTKMVRTVTIPIDAQGTFQLTTTNRFQWEIGGLLPDSTFTINIPADAKKVNDLYAALLNGDVGQLVGKVAPDFELNDLRRRRVRLSAYRGKLPVVLIFWATWCAPSTRDMPALNDFVEIARKVGVAVFAINLGEQAETVQPFVTARGYQGNVLLDPEKETYSAFRISSIPVTILIAKDGTIQSYFLGSSPEVRTQIRQATEALVHGK